MCFISNLGHNVVYIRACPDPDCKAAGAWGEFRKGKVFVICTTCRFQFQLLPKVRRAGRGVWVRRRADPSVFSQSGGSDDASQSRGRSAEVGGAVES